MIIKKKIVFVTQNLAPFRMKWLEELSKYYDIEVFHLDEYHSSVNKKYLSYVPQNVKIHSEYKILLKRKFYKNRLIIEKKKDILILDGYGFDGQVFLIFLLKIMRIPFILSVDGGFIPKKEHFYKKILKRFCINSPKAIMSTSKQTDHFIEHYCRKKPIIIRHYFSSLHINDLHLPNAEEKALYKKKYNLDGKFVVISVGRFVGYKSFEIILKALGHLSDDYCLLLVGGKPTKEYLDIVKEYRKGKVRFIDFKKEEDLRELYFASDVFAIASRGEIWGLVVGEAMGYGLPIISSKLCNAGIAMVEDGKNGYIIDDYEPMSYARHFTKLKANPNLCIEMAKQNIEKIKKYTIECSAKNDTNNFNEYLRMNANGIK